MQVEAQTFLRLAEKANTLAFFDIEAVGLKGDYNSILCISVKPYGKDPETIVVKQVGNDQRVVREAKELLESYDVWCGYFSKGFDVPMINTRLLKWEQAPLEKRLHIDMYYQLKYKTLTARRSQGHLLSWLGLPEQKMSVSADVWNQVAAEPTKHLPTLVERCESDCAGLEALYDRTKHLITDITR